MRKILLCAILAFPLIGGAYEQPINQQEVKIEKTVYVTRTGQKYHRQGCHYLKSCIPMDKGDAIRGGYTPCKVCQP